MNSQNVIRTARLNSSVHRGLFVFQRSRLFPHVVGASAAVLIAVTVASTGVTQAGVAIVVTFLLAVFFTALACGPAPGFTAALTVAVVFNYYFVPPDGFSPPTWEELFLLSGLLAFVLGIGALRDRMRAASHRAEQLSASEQLQQTLLNSVSHDLRAPLTSVIGSLGTILAEGERLDPAVRKELVSMSLDGARQLDRLLIHLLDMARLEAGAVRVRRELVDLEELLREVIGRFGPDTAPRCLLAMPSPTPSVRLDPALLTCALGNVLDNAVKYSPAHASINVDVGLTQHAVDVRVADRGPGIPDDQLDRVFEKFYRIRRATPTGAIHGAGLGLAIARGIVEAHGGRIWAEPRNGGGTTVTIRLPL